MLLRRIIEHTKAQNWTAVALDFLIVVFGVFIAIQVANWNDEREDRQKERLILTALASEFRANLQAADATTEFAVSKRQSAIELLRRAAGEIPSEDALDALLADISWWEVSEFTNGTLESVVLSGDLSLIQSTRLRQGLATTRRWYDLVERDQQDDHDTSRARLIPYYNQHASLRQINNAVRGKPGNRSISYGGPVPLDADNLKDHSGLLEQEPFLGIITLIIWGQDDVIFQVRNLRDHLQQLIKTIEDELEN